MKHLLCCIALIALLQGGTALAGSILTEISRSDDRETTQIYLTFDNLPYYSVVEKEKRVDITLETTRSSDSLKFFETDERIVKILPITNDNRMVISLFFRHRPDSVQTEKLNGKKLLIDIEIGNAPRSAGSIVSRKTADIKVPADAPPDSTHPLQNSPYANNWNRFFSDYESEISIAVPLRYTLPVFPIIDLLPPASRPPADVLPQEVRELARLKAWEEMQPVLVDLLEKEQDPQRQKLLALSLGDALLHAGAHEDADRQLNHFIKTFPADPASVYARFLLTCLNAIRQENFSVALDLAEIRNELGPTSPLQPNFNLLELESALASNRFSKASSLLERQDMAYPAELQNIVDLRRADIFAGLKMPLKAYAAFKLLKDPAIVSICPHSLLAYCETLYYHKKFKEADECYAALIPEVSDREASGLIAYRKAMTDTHLEPQRPALDSFTLIEEAFPLTEAAIRAAMKKTDLRFLADKTWGEEAVRSYGNLSEKAVKRELVAEADFKQALVNHLLGRNDVALQILMQFLRKFRSGELRPTAQALLLKILPEEIKRLVDSEKFPEALVLAKQNREVFQKKWIDISILGDLAYSYRHVGLYEHAKDLYLYIMDIVETPQREQYYLPLITSVSAQGDTGLVANLAGRYLNTYPDGRDRSAVLRLYLEALVFDGKYKDAEALLPEPLPEDDTLRSLAATLSFHQQDYPKTLSIIESISTNTERSLPEIRFMEAESLFQTGRLEDAGKLFLALQDDKLHFEQVLYRLAQIEIARGNTEEALKFYRQIVDKGKDDLWKRYAAKELEYLQSMERLRKKLQ